MIGDILRNDKTFRTCTIDHFHKNRQDSYCKPDINKWTADKHSTIWISLDWICSCTACYAKSFQAGPNQIKVKKNRIDF